MLILYIYFFNKQRNFKPSRLAAQENQLNYNSTRPTAASMLPLLTPLRSAMALSQAPLPVPCLKASFLWMSTISPSHLPYAEQQTATLTSKPRNTPLFEISSTYKC